MTTEAIKGAEDGVLNSFVPTRPLCKRPRERRGAAMCVPLWRNGNGMGMEFMRVVDRVMGTGREPGIWRELGNVHFLFKIKRDFATVHGPGPDGPCASC